MVAKRRLGVLVAVAVGAAVLVGLSAAASISARGDSAKPAKAANANGAAVSPGEFASKPKTEQQGPVDVAKYWTPERMRDAKPVPKTVPGGSPSAPAPSGGGAPADTGQKSASTGKPKVAPQQQAQSPLVKSPDEGGSTNDGWTQDEMDAAQPKAPTLPGGDGSGGASSSPPGGGTGAGIP